MLIRNRLDRFAVDVNASVRCSATLLHAFASTEQKNGERPSGKRRRILFAVNVPRRLFRVYQRSLTIRSFTQATGKSSLWRFQRVTRNVRFLGRQLDARSLLERSFEGVEVAHSSVLPSFSIAFCVFFSRFFPPRFYASSLFVGLFLCDRI